MKMETGKPSFDGQYVAYVPGLLEWLEPVIVTWTKGNWFYRHSSQEYPDQVIYWHGPLPVLKFAPLSGPELTAAFEPAPEYDL